MGISVLLAKLIGIPFLLIGLGFLFDRAHYNKVAKEVVSSAGLYFMSGVIAIVVGLAIVLYHNVWVSSWEVLITLVGWASLIKGVVRLLLPQWGMGVLKSWLKNENLMTFFAVLILVFGAVLTYYGFY